MLNAYTLIFGGFLLLGGRAADRLGRRRLFMAGIALFSAASLLCGLSQSEGMLLIARGLQGLGGAMVSPAALSLILTTFAEGPERNRALAVWGAIAGAGGAIGLLLGGLIVELLSWRWVFFVNVPIGAVVLALAPRIVPESRSERVSKGGYDIEGAAAITLGTIALVFTLIKADSWGWTSGRTLAGFGIAAVLIAAFLWIERRHRDPLVPLRIFSNRSLAAADATFLLVAAALFGVFFFLTLYFQQVLGYSALKTGVAYLPLSLTLIGASALASRLVDRFTPKPVLCVGLLTATVGFVSSLAHRRPRRLREPRAAGHDRHRVGPGIVVRTDHDRGHQRGRERRLRAGLGTAQHHPAGRRLAWARGPLLGFDQPRARARWMVALHSRSR